MLETVVSSAAPVTLVGGGDIGPGDLAMALAHAPLLVAADSGAGAALAAGHVPAAVIGDFDSITDKDKARIPADRLFPVAEQDDTDFEKSMSRIDAPLVVGVGFLGARVDHQLAAFNTLFRFRKTPCVLIGAHELVFHLPDRIALDLTPGALVSLFPLAQVTGRSEGLHWPIAGLVFEPGGRIGTSNRSTGPVLLQTDGPGLLAMVPRAALAAVVAGLRSPKDAARS